MWRVVTSAFIALTFISSAAWAQQPCTTDATRVVSELYRHIMERGPDDAAQHWTQQLSNGNMTIRDIVRNLVTSEEHHRRFGQTEPGEGIPYERAVARLYRHILGRQPDAEGQRTYAETAQQHGLDAVADSILNSQEYTNAFGDWGIPGSGGVSFCAPKNNDTANASPITDTRLRGLDRNNDGRITRAEWRGSDRAFRNQDSNNDGVLSGDEVRAGGRRADDRNFDALDANRNGRIERQEWQARLDEFNRLDINDDNVLTRAELEGDGTGAVGTSGSAVAVDSSVRWTDTGIDVRAGQTLVFDAQGRVRLSDNAADTARAGGSDSGRTAANAPVANAPAGALIARISSGAAVVVGDRRTWRAPRSGRLYLGVNDDHLADNEGAYDVTITVR